MEKGDRVEKKIDLAIDLLKELNRRVSNIEIKININHEEINYDNTKIS